MKQEFVGYCDPCETEMTHRSKDGTAVYCPNCWTMLPVPLEYVSPNIRLKEMKRRIPR